MRTMITTDGETISYAVNGDPKNKPVVLIHGFPLSSQMWESQVEALKKDFYVITYDLRGAGKSKSTKGPFTMEILVDDFLALLTYEKIDKPIVVGFSMGGFLALRAIERNPESMQALVLADTKSGADTNESKVKRTEAIKTIKSSGLAAYADVFLKTGVASVNAKPELLGQFKKIVDQNESQGVINSVLGLISRTDTTASLPQIKIPTLILVGDSDKVTPVEAAQEMQKAIKNSRLKIIPQSGHLAPMENSAAFNAELLQVLKGL